MRRKLLIFLIIVVCYILQTAVFPMIPFLGAVPNLMMVITVSIAFMQGSAEGALTGFICGLLLDISNPGPLGFSALLFVITGYFSGTFAEKYFDEDIKLPLLLTLVFDLVYNTIIYIAGFLLRGRTDFAGYLKNIILPEVVSTLIMLMLLYRIILKLNHVMREKEKKGIYSLWIRD